MKILQKICVGVVCLSLIFTLGCSKKPSASPSNAATAVRPNSATASKPTGTTTVVGSPVATVIATSKPVRTGPFDGGFASDLPVVCNLFSADNEQVFGASGKLALPMDDTEKTFAGQFFATTSFNYIEAACPSFTDNIGNMTMSIYNWKDDYATTVAGKAIKSLEFVDYSDNLWLRLVFDTPLPAGEYLWVLSNPVETVGIWDIPTGPDKHESDVRCYVSGEVIDTYHIVRLEYTKTPNIILEKLS